MAQATMRVRHEVFDEEAIAAAPWPEGTPYEVKGISELDPSVKEYLISHPDIPDDCDFVNPFFTSTESGVVFDGWNPVILERI